VTTTSGPRVRVLRGLHPAAADIGTVRAPIARDLVVDPALVQDATESGYRAGYDAGFTAGLEDAASAIDSRERTRSEQLRSTLDQLRAAADALGTEHRSIVADIEARVVDIAVAVATELVGHDLAHSDERGREALARALRFAPEGAPVVARLHPDDVATADLESVHAELGSRNLSIVADTTLRPGDCIVDVGATRIDARIAPAIERVRAVLRGGQA
jgi:flagellar assembly protein FliH